MKIKIMELGVPDENNSIFEERDIEKAINRLKRDHKEGPLLTGEEVLKVVFDNLDDFIKIRKPIIFWDDIFIEEGDLYGILSEENMEYIENNFVNYTFRLREVGIPLSLSSRHDRCHLIKDLEIIAIDIKGERKYE